MKKNIFVSLAAFVVMIGPVASYSAHGCSGSAAEMIRQQKFEGISDEELRACILRKKGHISVLPSVPRAVIGEPKVNLSKRIRNELTRMEQEWQRRGLGTESLQQKKMAPEIPRQITNLEDPVSCEEQKVKDNDSHVLDCEKNIQKYNKRTQTPLNVARKLFWEKSKLFWTREKLAHCQKLLLEQLRMQVDQLRRICG